LTEALELNPKKILVVDSAPNLVTAVRGELTGLGISGDNIFGASTGKEALTILMKELPIALLTDHLFVNGVLDENVRKVLMFYLSQNPNIVFWASRHKEVKIF